MLGLVDSFFNRQWHSCGNKLCPIIGWLVSLFIWERFLDTLIKESKVKLARKFNLSYRYIDDLIFFSDKRFKEFISDIYLKELTISETTESDSVACYLDQFFYQRWE